MIGSSGPSRSRPRRKGRRGLRLRRVRTCSSRLRRGRARRSRPSSGGSIGSSPSRAREEDAAGLCLAAEGTLVRHREEPPRSAQGHRRGHRGGDPDRRHAAEGAPADAPQATRRADHDARVPLLDADLQGAGVSDRRGVGDRRRDPRRGPHEARAPTWRCRSSASSTWRRGRSSGSACRPPRGPLEEVGRFLAGPSRDCRIVDTGVRKQLDLEIRVPVEDMREPDAPDPTDPRRAGRAPRRAAETWWARAWAQAAPRWARASPG